MEPIPKLVLSAKEVRAFEHHFIRYLRDLKIGKCGILVAVSGGADSVVLYELLKKWQRLLGFKLAVGHVHHGIHPRKAVSFRDKAARFVLTLTSDELLFTNGKLQQLAKGGRVSEAALRDLRWHHLRKWRSEWAASLNLPVFVATAHSADDLLETRIQRLLRGTGPAGLVAMQGNNGEIIRPLLPFSAIEIRAYARAAKIKWVEDPSNTSVAAQRNWLRHKWLPMLERRMPGAKKAMARSLQNLVEALSESQTMPTASGQIRRSTLQGRTKPQCRQIIASFLRQMGIFDYTENHLNEILKRLDKKDSKHIFRLLGRVWVLSPEQLSLGRDSQANSQHEL